MISNSTANRFLLTQTFFGTLGGSAVGFAFTMLIIHVRPGVYGVGLMQVAQTIPGLLVMPIVGPYLDRLPLTRSVLGVALVGAAVLGAIPLFYHVDATYWIFVGIIAAITALSQVQDTLVAYFLTPLFNIGSERRNINGLLSMVARGSSIIGPVIAGLLVHWIGPEWPPAMVGVTDLLLAVALVWLLRRSALLPSNQPNKRPSPFEGIRSVFGIPALPRLASVMFFVNLVTSASQAMGVYALRVVFHQPMSIVGVCSGLTGAAAFLGSLLFSRWKEYPLQRVFRRGLWLLAIAICVATALLGRSVWGFATAWIISFIAVPLVLLSAQTFRQSIIPKNSAGSINGSYRLLTGAAIPLSGLLYTGFGSLQRGYGFISLAVALALFVHYAIAPVTLHEASDASHA